LLTLLIPLQHAASSFSGQSSLTNKLTMVIFDSSHYLEALMTTCDPALTLRAARDVYFAANGFGADGGYSAEWVDFKLGPVPMPFPNTRGRVRAVRYHDLHHLLTGYATDTLGEFEISAWELGAGCKDFWAAWQLNLGGTAAGAATIPRRAFRAFVRGRRTSALYGRDLEALLDRTVGEMRAECGLDRSAAPRASDYLLFAAAVAVGSVVGLLSFAALLAFGPLLFLAWVVRGMPRVRAEPAARA
jgi:hypothetical protein